MTERIERDCIDEERNLMCYFSVEERESGKSMRMHFSRSIRTQTHRQGASLLHRDHKEVVPRVLACISSHFVVDSWTGRRAVVGVDVELSRCSNLRRVATSLMAGDLTRPRRADLLCVETES
jgi:hypothetical protein